MPDLADLQSEPDHVHELYGTQPGKSTFANNCLLARRMVERGVRFVQLYTASVFAAALAQLITQGFSDPVPTVGASGGLFGLLGAYALLFPRRRVMLLFPPIPLPAPVFVTLYAAFELYAGVTGTMSGVAHFAHLGGLAGGLLLLRSWRRRARR